jgi:hypothetical protein
MRMMIGMIPERLIFGSGLKKVIVLGQIERGMIMKSYKSNGTTINLATPPKTW